MHYQLYIYYVLIKNDVNHSINVFFDIIAGLVLSFMVQTVDYLFD